MLDLYIGRHLLTSDLLPGLCKTRTVVVADSALSELYAKQLAKKLKAELVCIPSGEAAKTAAVREQIEQFLLRGGYDRDTTVIALGGGSTSDVVGFVASTYLRGVPLILVPTTLLAMVDASIGGKNGINTEFGKNLLGTFYQPKAIVVDLETLKSLPDAEKRNGLAEIFKMGLIARPDLFDLEFEELIRAAIKQKLAIVEQDPKETGLRRILNFGHTVGHALEKVSAYKMPHGVAVAMGCVVESHLSMQLGFLSKGDFKRILALYEPFHLPEGYSRQSFVAALSADKKRAAGEVRFVLIEQIGKVLAFDGQYCRPVKLEEMEKTLDWMEAVYG